MSGQNKKMFGCLCLLAMLAGFAAPVLAGVSVSENTGDGLRKVVLENDYWKLVFTPEKCGSCTSLFYKPAQKEFTGDTGVFSDYVLEQPMQQGDWAGKPYTCTTSKNAKEASVTLSRPGTSFKFVAISKTITLTEGSPVIRADYTFANQTEAMGPVTISPRYHNVLFLPEDCVYSFAGPKGCRKMEYVHGTSVVQPEYWEHNPVRGWSFLAGKKSGVGLACLFNYPITQNLYDWFGNGPSSIATIEWFSNPVTIEAGKSFRDVWYLIPFERISEIQDVSPEMVAGIRQEGSAGKGTQASFSFQVWPTVAGKAEIVFRMGRLPGRKYTTLRQASVELKPGVVSTESCAFVPAAEGTYVVQASVALNGKETALAEIPVIVGKSEEVYLMEPREKKVSRSKEERFLPLVLKPDYVTPHWAWAKPYREGPVRALFLMDIESQREIIELYERMDLEYANATITKNTYQGQAYNISWYPPDLWKKTTNPQIAREGNRQAEELLEKEYDVILVSGCRSSCAWNTAVEWEKFTDKARTKILEKVKTGTGLVVVQPQAMKLTGELEKIYQQAVPAKETDYPARGIPFTMLPALRSSGAVFGGGVPPLTAKNIKLANLGQGRIVFLDYDTRGLTPDTDIQHTRFASWEYYYSLAIRSLLYAGKKESPLSISSVECPADTLTAGDANPAALRVTVDGNAGKKMSLALRIVGEDGEDEGLLSAPVSSGEKQIPVSLPALKAGRHLVTATLKDGEKTADFRTVVIEIKSPVKMDLSLVKDVLGKDDPVQGEIKLENNQALSGKVVLEVSLTDTYGRLVFFNALPVSPSNNTYSFQTALPDRLSRIYDLKAVLKDDARSLVAVHREITFPEAANSMNDLYGVVWAGLAISDYLTLENYRLFRQIGLGVLDAWDRYFPVNSYLMAKANAPVFGHVNLYHMGLSGEALVKMKTTHVISEKGCVSDPKYQASVLSIISNNITSSLRYGPAFYLLADEPSHYSYDGQADACWCPLCQEGFRVWLKSVYGSLENLNQEWGTAFARWEDVKPSWEDEMKGETSSFARWSDFRSYMDIVYLDLNRKIRGVKDELAPQTRYGVSGVVPHQHIFSGNRWEVLKDVFNMHSLYGDGELQSALNPDSLNGRWNGYFADEAHFQYTAWQSLLGGGRYLSFWFASIFILPDFRLAPYYGKPLESLMTEVNSGIGTLFFNSRRQTHPIAIHYSHPSAQAFYILKHINDMDTISVFRKNIEDYKLLIKEIGFLPTFVSDEDLRNGKLQKAGIKVLILPLSIALGDAESVAVRRFVENGGVAIADFLTGKMDEHLKVRASSPLDGMFGITSSRDLCLVNGEYKSRLTLAGKNQEVSGSFMGPATGLAGGTAAGIVACGPVKFGNIVFTSQTGTNLLWISRDAGKGKAIYLNFLTRYASAGKENKQALRELFGAVLRSTGIVKSIEVKGDNGTDPLECEVSEFANGPIRLFGLMRPLDSLNEEPGLTMDRLRQRSVKTFVTFSKPAHVYDLRAHEYLGYGSSFTPGLAPGLATVLTAVPFKVQKPSLSLNVKSVDQGEPLKYTVDMNTGELKEGILVVKMDVFQPDGRLSEAYSKRLAFAGGTFTGTIPLALNDMKGKWRVRVTEAIAGLSDENKFTVK